MPPGTTEPALAELARLIKRQADESLGMTVAKPMERLLARMFLLVELAGRGVIGATNSQEPTVFPTATPNVPPTIEAGEQSVARKARVEQIIATIRAPTPTPIPTFTAL